MNAEEPPIAPYSHTPADWKLSIRPAKPNFTVGAEMNIVITFTNTTKTPLRVMAGHPLADYEIHVFRGKSEIPIATKAIIGAIDYGSRTRELAPGKALKDTIELLTIIANRAQLTPGDYTITARRNLSSLGEKGNVDIAAVYVTASSHFIIDPK